jgi:hypothetical protein
VPGQVTAGTKSDHTESETVHESRSYESLWAVTEARATFQRRQPTAA